MTSRRASPEVRAGKSVEEGVLNLLKRKPKQYSVYAVSVDNPRSKKRYFGPDTIEAANQFRASHRPPNSGGGAKAGGAYTWKVIPESIDEDTTAPTPPTPAGGTGVMQGQQKPQQTAGTNSTTAPSTQPSKPITAQMTGQAAKLADKMKSDPNLGNKQAMAGRVKSLIGTVGGQSKDSAMMTDLVAAQLVGQGDLDPNKIK